MEAEAERTAGGARTAGCLTNEHARYRPRRGRVMAVPSEPYDEERVNRLKEGLLGIAQECDQSPWSKTGRLEDPVRITRTPARYGCRAMENVCLRI